LINAAVFSQGSADDSLRLVLKTAANDTTRCKALNKMIEDESDPKLWYPYYEDLDSICQLHLNSISLSAAEKEFYTEYLANAIVYLATYKEEKGEIFEAIACFKKSLAMYEGIDDKAGVAIVLGNLAGISNLQGNIPAAIEYYRRSLKIHEAIGDKLGIAIAFNNLGFMYANQFDYKNSLEYFGRSLSLRYEIGDRQGAALALSNIAGTMLLKVESKFNKESAGKKKKDVLDAHALFKKSFAIYDSLGDKRGIAMVYNSTGFLFMTYAKWICEASPGICNGDGNKMALEHLLKSLEIRILVGEKRKIAESHVNVGTMYAQLKDNTKTLEYTKIGLKMGKELGYPGVIRLASSQLYDTYKKTGNYTEALKNYELYIVMKDSLNNIANRKATIKQQLRYEYEKKSAADSVSHAKESAIKTAELSRQSAEIKAKKNQQYALFGGLILVALFSIFMFNRFKVTQKQKAIIENQKKVVEEQKYLVEEKQREVLESIRYARRIQLAQIPSEKRILSMINKIKKN
jgi:tetratricopeptide (TPR) repeat protein